MMSLKDCVEALNNRPELAGLDIWGVAKRISIQSHQSATTVKNTDLTTFETKQVINKASDGMPRYIYWGKMRPTETRTTDFLYRGLRVELNSSSSTNSESTFLIDFASTTVLTLQYWYFEGFIIDRGA